MASSRWRLWLGCTAAVAGLWALAVAQPVLDVVKDAPEFFVAHHADRLDMVSFVGWAVLLPPLAAGLVIGLGALVGRRSANAVAGVLVGALIAVFVLQIGYRLGATSWTAAAGIAVVTAALGIAAWLTLRGFRVAVTVAGVAAFVVPVSFLTAPGIRALMHDGTAALGPVTANDLPPVVLIVFDELPLVTLLDGHGRIDATRYPNFAALASDGVWFRNATTVSDYTRWAVPAILSGRYPKGLSIPTPGDYPNNLFTLLAPSHRMEILEPLTDLCPASLSGENRGPLLERQHRMLADVKVVASHILLPPDARTSLPDITQGWADFSNRDAEFARVWKRQERGDYRVAAMSFVDGVSSDDTQPTLYFMHALVSHHPPRWLASGQEIAYFTPLPGKLPGLVWTTTEWPVIQQQQGHLVQAGLADLLVGRLVERLRKAGIYERAMVVITSDHGMSFRPGDELRDFTATNAGEILPVPLVVKLPSDRQLLPPGTVDDQNIETIDILPTIADGIGVRLAWPIDGTSALRPRSGRAEKRIYFNKNIRSRRFTTQEVARMRDSVEARKVSLFGTNAWPSPAPPGLERLVGQSVDLLTIGDPVPGFRIQIDDSFGWDAVDLKGPALPVQVKGRVLRPAGLDRSAIYFAITLNGEIAATTRTWSEKADFRALLPPGRLRNGLNELDVFLVDPATPQRLVRTVVRRTLPPDADLLFGKVGSYGVTYEGFHHLEQAHGTHFHWTDGAASIVVPVDLRRRPTTLSVGVLEAARAGMQVRVLIDACEVATLTMPGGPWSQDLAIGHCVPRARWMRIRFLSESVRPGDHDRRRLGVALTEVRLR